MVWSSDVDHKHILVVNKPAHIQLPAFVFTAYTWELQWCPDGELNPGLPRDRRGYSPLYYLMFY